MRSTTVIELLLLYEDHRTSPMEPELMNPPTNPPSNPATGPSIQLSTEAVVAAYIHEISDRHRRSDQAAEERPSPPAGD
jgi:hypothetical protein